MISELLLRIREKFKDLYGEEPDIIVSAPGRIDLLNTHQDYKGLPVVGAAINLRCYVASSLRNDGYVHAFSDNASAGESNCIFQVNEAISADIRGKDFCNYVKAIYKVLYNEIGLSKGLNIYIKGHVPIGAGLGSSAALEVALIKAITSLFNINLSNKNIAELAYRAEHDVMGIPCGRLDQYSSTYGGLLLINTKPPYRVEEIPFNEGIFVILDSGIRHKTAEIHPVRQKEINKALSELLSMNDLPSNLRVKLGAHYWEPAWELLSEDELIPYITRLNDVSRRRILFTLRMHKSTIIALSILKGNMLSIDEVIKSLGISKADALRLIPKESKGISKKLLILGLIMNYQHELLRDLYDVSLPSIERIRNAVLNAGALGCKLSGAGLGGSVVALVSNYEDAWIVLREGLKAGAINGWITQLDQGVRREF
mgnify:CR=1 FL=1